MTDIITYLILWFLIFVISIILCKYLNPKLYYWNKTNILGPKPLPFFGTRYSYIFRSLPEVELDWYQKYGKLYGIYNGHNPAISVAHPELIKQILVKDFNNFPNRSKLFIFTHPIWEKTMFFGRDDLWKRVRAISSPAFTSGKLKKMLPLITECCNNFMANLDEYAKHESEIDIKKLDGTYAMDVIAKCAFAVNTNSHKEPDNGFIKNILQLINVEIWKVVISLLLPSFISKNDKFRKYLAVAYEPSMFFTEISRQLIKQRKDKPTEKHNDFLQLLLDVERNDEVFTQTDNMAVNHLNEGQDEKLANTNAFKDVIEKKLTENEIIAQCVLLFLAAFETTSLTLAYCSYELSLYPEVQQKLYNEINTAFADRDYIDYETLLRLPYLDAVISETLRKYPPLIRLERQAINDIVLGDTGITIPKRMVAEIPVYAIHHDPDYYKNPFLFNPERFMPENRSKIKPYTYLPFGIGPRNCIGMRFALLEVKLAIVNIVRKFILFRTANTIIPLKFKKENIGGLSVNHIIFIGIKRRF